MQRSFEQVLAAQCAPTLAGVKRASLFRCRGEDLAAACRTVAAWGRTVARSGLSVRVLKLCPKDGALLVYVYRERQLAALLADGETQAFLRGAGYCPGGCGDMLTQLSRRLRCAEEFPHEIGVFLGYPLEDVKGFPQDQLRVALPYWAGVTADMDDAARDRLWDATARGMACAARRRHVRRVRPLPLTDGLTVNGRGHSLGNARADFERHVAVLSWEATA